MGFWVRRILGMAGVLALACWVGGLAFYGGVVLPVLHERFGVEATAPVTRRATSALNGIGLVALGLWWIACWLEGRSGMARGRRWPVVVLGLSTLILAVQFPLHGALARQMDLGRSHSGGFYPLHRVYLIVSTLQWLANLALLLSALRPTVRPAPAEASRS